MEKSGGSIFLNILKVIASLFLSFLFIIIAFVFPVYSSFAGLIRPNNIVSVVQNIDYVEILKESEEFDNAIKELGIETNAANEIIKSKAVGNMLEECTEIVTNVLTDEKADIENFDVSSLKEVANNHVDDIVVVLQKNLNKEVKTQDVRDGINKLFDENSDAIKDAVLDLAPEQDTISAYRTVVNVVEKSTNWVAVLIVSLVEILFLGLIYLMFSKKHGGFIWIAVDSGIAAVLTLAVIIVLNSGIVKTAMADFPSFVSNVATSMLGVIIGKLIIATVVFAVVMIAAIVAFVLIKKFANKPVAVVGEVIELQNTEEEEVVTKEQTAEEQPTEEVNE